MTETVSKVYDLTYPSPATLKEISSIVVAVDLWREEICVCLKSNTLEELNLATKNIQLENAIPNLPSAIYSFLEEYITAFRKSIVHWLDYHNDKVFTYYFNSLNSMLSRFHDFALDWDGTIHYPRTAKRMMLSDQFDEDEKFMIACFYCFEDDIKRIWPSVNANNGNPHNDVFYLVPQFYYWVCYLRNELRKVPTSGDEFNLDEMMLYKCESNNQTCMKYFWDRLPSDRQSQINVDRLRSSGSYPELFVRFILQTLNEDQLEVFVAENGGTLMSCLFSNDHEPALLPHVLPAWMYIRDKMNESNFIWFVQNMLKAEMSKMDEHFRSRSVVYLFGEVWKSASQHLKQSALNHVLHDEVLILSYVKYSTPWGRRAMKLLITVLQDATFEEMNAFWLKYWRNFIFGVPIEDLLEFIKLSFRNENEITLFKENIMSMYENIAEGCTSLMEHAMVEELNDLLSICCPDVRKRRELKRRLLRSNYTCENNAFTRIMFINIKLLNEFIDDAFHDAADLGVEFRNQFASSPVTRNCLFGCIRRGDFVHLMEFVDTFFPEEQTVVSVKKRISERFKERLIDGDVLLRGSDDLQRFLIWLLGSEGEVTRFKQSIPIEDTSISRTMIAGLTMRGMARQRGDETESSERLDNFLMWYFNKDEKEIEKFKERLPVELKLFVSRKRRRT